MPGRRSIGVACTEEDLDLLDRDRQRGRADGVAHFVSTRGQREGGRRCELDDRLSERHGCPHPEAVHRLRERGGRSDDLSGGAHHAHVEAVRVGGVPLAGDRSLVESNLNHVAGVTTSRSDSGIDRRHPLHGNGELATPEGDARRRREHEVGPAAGWVGARTRGRREDATRDRREHIRRGDDGDVIDTVAVADKSHTHALHAQRPAARVHGERLPVVPETVPDPSQGSARDGASHDGRDGRVARTGVGGVDHQRIAHRGVRLGAVERHRLGRVHVGAGGVPGLDDRGVGLWGRVRLGRGVARRAGHGRATGGEGHEGSEHEREAEELLHGWPSFFQ